MKLPAELRLEVAEHSLTITKRKLPIKNCALSYPDLDLALLQTSRQVRSECASLVERARLQLPPTIILHIDNHWPRNIANEPFAQLIAVVRMLAEGCSVDKFDPTFSSSDSEQQLIPYVGLHNYTRCISYTRGTNFLASSKDSEIAEFYCRTIRQLRGTPVLTIRFRRTASFIEYPLMSSLQQNRWIWHDLNVWTSKVYPNALSLKHIFVANPGEKADCLAALGDPELNPGLLPVGGYTVEESKGDRYSWD
jgi:hypothetical protein